MPLDEPDFAEPQPDSERSIPRNDGEPDRMAICHHCEEDIHLYGGPYPDIDWRHDNEEVLCDAS
jgi:hypothetical protein